MQEISGASLLELIEKQKQTLKKAEEIVENRTRNIMEEMETDFQNIINNMNALVQELLTESRKQIKQYKKEQIKQMREIVDQINQYEL